MNLKNAISILVKRKDWLTKRVNESDRDLTYDKAEIKAIKTVLDNLPQKDKMGL